MRPEMPPCLPSSHLDPDAASPGDGLSSGRWRNNYLSSGLSASRLSARGGGACGSGECGCAPSRRARS